MGQKKKSLAAKVRQPASVERETDKQTDRRSADLGLKQADLLVRRAAQEYVEQAAAVEAARINRWEIERRLGEVYAKQAEGVGRPFYNFLAQGDSWLDYSCGSAIVYWLKRLFKPENAYIDNIADSGRTLREMLSREFREHLAAGPPNGSRWSGVILSGGGNDICGRHRFKEWLKPYDGGAQPPEHYIHPDFDRELDTIRKLYIEIIDLVSQTDKQLRVFAHEYDFAIPDNRCVTGHSPHFKSDYHFCFAGPWLWPAFEDRGFHRTSDEAFSQLTCDIVVAILRRFASMLQGLERQYPDHFCVVHTQGILKPIQATQRWANELHPYDDSFEVLARAFFDKLISFVRT